MTFRRVQRLAAAGVMLGGCVAAPAGTGSSGGSSGAQGSSSGGGMASGGGGGASGSGPSGSGGASASGGAGSGGTPGLGGSTGGGGGAGPGSGGSKVGTGGVSGSGGATSGSGGRVTGTGGVIGSGGATSGSGGRVTGTGGASGNGGASASAYDKIVLGDGPVAFWAMNKTTTEPDLTGNANTGTYKGSAPVQAALPNGDYAADFNGVSQYLTIPSNKSFSVTATGDLTWEAWIRADVLQFPKSSGDGYVDWMGKCQDYGPTCEWEARMYDTTTAEGRPNRLSAYIFNPKAGLGSAADWQPVANLIQAATWYHVVGEYTTKMTPSDCMDASASMGCQNVAMYPGAINIWVDGVEWNHASHGDTGCMCQYGVVPVANSSPLNIGTMSMDTWFAGAIGKVAIYDRLLTPAEITAHYRAMSGKDPTGTCRATCSF